jgi:hypothetical protein
MTSRFCHPATAAPLLLACLLPSRRDDDGAAICREVGSRSRLKIHTELASLIAAALRGASTRRPEAAFPGPERSKRLGSHPPRGGRGHSEAGGAAAWSRLFRRHRGRAAGGDPGSRQALAGGHSRAARSSRPGRDRRGRRRGRLCGDALAALPLPRRLGGFRLRALRPPGCTWRRAGRPPPGRGRAAGAGSRLCADAAHHFRTRESYARRFYAKQGWVERPEAASFRRQLD